MKYIMSGVFLGLLFFTSPQLMGSSSKGIGYEACRKAYVKERFRLVAKMALAKKKNDQLSYVDYQHKFEQLLSVERMMKEYRQNKEGQERRDFYIRMEEMSVAKIDKIMSTFTDRGLFCLPRANRKKGLDLQGIDEVEDIVRLIK